MEEGRINCLEASDDQRPAVAILRSLRPSLAMSVATRDFALDRFSFRCGKVRFTSFDDRDTSKGKLSSV